VQREGEPRRNGRGERREGEGRDGRNQPAEALDGNVNLEAQQLAPGAVAGEEGNGRARTACTP
jgi:ribonuclease E